jgi:ribosomal protein L11 methyltransferase
MKQKSSKPLWRISVATTAEAEDAVGELLASIFNVATAAYFDVERRVSHVSVFLEQKQFSPAGVRKEIAAGLDRIRNFGLNTGVAKVEIARVKREDWAESWKKHFKPIEIKVKQGRRGSSKFRSLLIKPSWSKKRPVKNQVTVILDPGLSFGTGQHPTTSFCLHEVARCLKSGSKSSFLDIGTGSGILAIAAAKLGYAPAHAFDFDPESVRVAKENAAKNHVAGKLKLTRGDITKLPLLPVRQYDLVCANLISTLLIAERQRIVNRVKPGGTLVLAGILAAEFSDVECAFGKLNFKLQASRTENEWRSGSFCFV